MHTSIFGALSNWISTARGARKLKRVLRSGNDSEGARRALLDGFTLAYIQCMLWVEMDNATEQGGEPLEDHYDIGDIAPDTLLAIVKDCQRFQTENRAYLDQYDHPEYSADELGGHDYWLTRNRHGAGYWDRDCLPPDAREQLTSAAHRAGERSAYVGDDKLIYLA